MVWQNVCRNSDYSDRGEGMKVAEYKQIDTKTEEYTITVPPEYDEEGNITSEEHEETRTREVPVMGMVYRDMTPEEIVEMEKAQADMPEPAPTPEERIRTLEEQNQMLTECLLEVSEQVYK